MKNIEMKWVTSDGDMHDSKDVADDHQQYLNMIDDIKEWAEQTYDNTRQRGRAISAVAAWERYRRDKEVEYTATYGTK